MLQQAQEKTQTQARYVAAVLERNSYNHIMVITEKLSKTNRVGVSGKQMFT